MVGGAGTPGAIRPGAGGPAEAAATAGASSIHLNCGGTNVDRTDSAGVVWLYDLPFLISPNPQQFALGADSVSGISAPLDQNDVAHQQMLDDMRFDVSSTRHSGSPGVLEYSFCVVGNFVYTLRLWGAEVAGSTNVTGGRVSTISYDYGAGTTVTFGTTFDIYGLAGAYYKAAAWEQQFTITATGAQTLRIEINGGGISDFNPLFSALEITGSAQSVVTPVGPTVGQVFRKGYVITTQQGLRFQPTAGLKSTKGFALELASKHVDKPLTSGNVSMLGNSPMFSTGIVRTPALGIITHKGESVNALLPAMINSSPAEGRVTMFGGHAIARTPFPTQWTELERATAIRRWG